ncbi:ComEC/Rec2 family competence protein [Streptomyces sp. MRC013]|uniref:ComEC/Rec2 family competence protein n=1 Tax=Streptomyces sp. MRC013 TaxID=2898276 RepID=UPI00202727EF|nr:ComEC/Rec2 family competence protein [Streptomyces sp. MRC013]URM91433.1 ComEC/Rec2 family competence protein [Streptomyces sp. MRC013]
MAPALAAWGAAAVALGLPGRWAVTGVALCGAGAVALLLDGWRRRTARASAGWRRRNATAYAAVLLCAAAGAASAGLHGADLRRGPVPALAGEHASVTADVAVRSDPRPTVHRVRGDRTVPASVVLDAEVTRVTAPDGTTTRVRTPVLVMARPGEEGRHGGAWLRLLPSTTLRVTGRLAPPRDPGDPFAAVLYAGTGPPRVTGPPSALHRTAGRLRAGLREATDGLPADARALLPGLVVGDTSRIPEDLRRAFEATDLTHLLAVSGSNLTIVLLLLIGPAGTASSAERGGLAPRLGVPLRGTALLGGALTLAFVVVCRPEPSVLRAAACGLITLLAIATGRRRSLIPALAGAVLLLVLYEPWLARSHGFLLSVLATGALLTIAPRWSAALRARGTPPRIAEALAAAAAAQAVCAPVVAVFAARVSLVAIPCNLFAELAVAPATVLGFAALGAAPLAMPAARLLAECAAWPAGWVASVARTGASLPGAQVDWPGGWRGGLLLAAVTAALLLAVGRLPYRPWVAAGCVGLLLLAVLRPVPLVRVVTGWPPPGWVFAMCDVGQGDASVLAAGGGTAVVVDAGPDPEPVDRCLRDLGVSRVPLVLLTHFHADHVTGLPGVLRGRSVGGGSDDGTPRPAGPSRVRPPHGRRGTRPRGPRGTGGAAPDRGARLAGAVARADRRVRPRGPQRRQCHPARPDPRRSDPAAPRRSGAAVPAEPLPGTSRAAGGRRPQGRAPRLGAPGPRTARQDASAARTGVGRAGQSVRAPLAPHARRPAGCGRGRAAHRSGRRHRGGGLRSGPAGGHPPPPRAPAGPVARPRRAHANQVPSRIRSRSGSSASSRHAFTVRGVTRR